MVLWPSFPIILELNWALFGPLHAWLTTCNLLEVPWVLFYIAFLIHPFSISPAPGAEPKNCLDDWKCHISEIFVALHILEE